MNRQFEDVGFAQMHGDSPPRRFGVPLPGDPSIMFTIQKNQLSELQKRYANTMSLVNQISRSSSGRVGPEDGYDGGDGAYLTG